jgi:hypothetical protein
VINAIVATDWKIAALQITDYLPRFFVSQRDMNFI